MEIKRSINTLLNYILILLIIAITVFTINLEKYLWLILIASALISILIFLLLNKSGKRKNTYFEDRDKSSTNRLFILPVFLVIFYLTEVETVVLILFGVSIFVLLIKEVLRK